MNWYLEVLKKYAVFNGRARRKEYWMFFLFNNIIGWALFLVERLAGSPGILDGLYSLAVFIPDIAVRVRRLHDTNRSGWWVLIVLVPAIVSLVFVALMFMTWVNLIGWLLFTSVVTLVGAIVFLVFMLQDSQWGENRYGPNPKEATA